MSKIVNEAKIKNKIIVKVREQLEHRAFWLYLLTDEAEKRGRDFVSYYKMRIVTGLRPCKSRRNKELEGLEENIVHKGSKMGI